MCGQSKFLANSHFMPAFLYPYCRTGDLRPVKFFDGTLLPTDRQTQAPLLCEDCEHVLSDGGEAWIANKLATWERTFPLSDLLTSCRQDIQEEGLTVYFTNKNPEVRADKLLHFGMGMFWKAGVHSWRRNSTEPWIELGPYADMIRAWLRGEATFPDHVYLTANVFRPERAQIALIDPYEAKRKTWRSFFFHVPGLLFMLCIGKTVDPSLKWLSIHNPEKPICISDDLAEHFINQTAIEVRSSRLTEAYMKHHERVSRVRGSSAS